MSKQKFKWGAVAINFFSDDVYSELYANYPSFNTTGAPSNVRVQYSMRDWSRFGGDQDMAPIWYVLASNVPDFFSNVVHFFKDEIEINKDAGYSYKDLADPANYGIRGIDTDKLFLYDVQPGINTPVTTGLASSVRGIHLDNPLELFALLVYFKDDSDPQGGDLEFWHCQNNESLVRRGKADYSGDFERIGKLAYEKNVAALFYNTDKSFHAVTERRPGEYNRNLLNIILEVNPVLCNETFKLPENSFFTRLKYKILSYAKVF